MNIYAQRELRAYAPFALGNNGEYNLAGSRIYRDFWTELTKNVNADTPMLFLDTYDYEITNQFILGLQQTYHGCLVKEWNIGIGRCSFPVGMPKDDPFDCDCDFPNEPGHGKDDLSDLYKLLFSRNQDEKWNFLVIKGFSQLIRQESFVTNWFRSALTYQMNRQDKKLPRCIIIVEPFPVIPDLLVPYSVKLSIPKPPLDDIERIFEYCMKDKNIDGVQNGENKKKIANYLYGCTQTEIENILRLSVQGCRRFDELYKKIINAKESVIQRTGVLSLIKFNSKPVFGGLANLKRHLEMTKIYFENKKEFRDAKLQLPRGILLVGMPGCGKSLAAKATAAILEKPLLQLEFGKILGKYVGESETNFKIALEAAEKSAPCVLWIDELEKAFAGMNDTSGVTKRLFGIFLTWMQESKSEVYIIATANDISNIPPEFKRKGRFDKIFSLVMPTESERKDIFEVKFRSLGNNTAQNVMKFCEEFARMTRYSNMCNQAGKNEDQGLNGADIEAIVKDAFCRAVVACKYENKSGHLVMRKNPPNVVISKDDVVKAIESMKGKTQRDIMGNDYKKSLDILKNSGFEQANEI